MTRFGLPASALQFTPGCWPDEFVFGGDGMRYHRSSEDIRDNGFLTVEYVNAAGEVMVVGDE